VQFVAELAMAMVDDMSDFSAARIDAAYARWDEDFDAREDVAKRFERVFGLVASLRPESVRDTIFSRSPVFFSLVLVLDSRKKLPSKTALERGMHDIDNRFNDSRPASERPEVDVDFAAAVSASTQRIKSRQSRFDYISNFI
jgi:hypothetical protein